LAHTHHKLPLRRGGTNDPRNLVTLCFPCHATRPSTGHRRLLEGTDPNQLPNFVKWLIWDLGLNLIGYAEWLDPRRFPAEQVLNDLQAWQDFLGLALEWTKRVTDAKSKSIVGNRPRPRTPTVSELEGVLRGVRIGFFAHGRQQYLDQESRQARQR
jgi:hypothetical protein